MGSQGLIREERVRPHVHTFFSFQGYTAKERGPGCGKKAVPTENDSLRSLLPYTFASLALNSAFSLTMSTESIEQLLPNLNTLSLSDSTFFAPSQPIPTTYFDKFRSAGFIPDPTASILTEFKRLAKLRGWKVGTKQYYHHKSQCFAGEFETHYGNKTERLEGWQSLCWEVGIEPAPGSVTQCKKASNYIMCLPYSKKKIQIQCWTRG